MLETIDGRVLILLVGRNETDADSIRDALADSALHLYRLQTIKHLPTALARVAGGGVSAVLLDISESEPAGMESLRILRAEAPQVPVIVLYDSASSEFGAEGLAERAMRAGAADCLATSACQTHLRQVVGGALEQSNPRKGSGKTIAWMGAKGGVGATTTGLNVASALARDTPGSGCTVILAELRSQMGSLAPYCRPQRLTRTAGHLVKMKPGMIGPKEVEACLWPYDVPRLRLLFGPQDMQPAQEISTEHVRTVFAALSHLAEYVILDLPASLDKSNCMAIQGSDLLILVVERDPVCVQMARLTLQAIASGDASPPLMGAVIVNRSPLASPMDMNEVEAQLGIPIFGVIPPAADNCAFAQKARAPLIGLEPDGLAATSFFGVARELERRLPVSRQIAPAHNPSARLRARGADSTALNGLTSGA